MIWAIAIVVLYVIGIIVTATLLYLHIEDHPDWATNPKAVNPEFDQVMSAVAASVFCPVTLLVVITIKARTRWMNREVEA